MRILKASAGSGKTYRLSHQYIDILLGSPDRYAYRHILAVTFTNKATAGMKSRILKDLNELSAKDPRAREILIDILHDYSAFAVSTKKNGGRIISVGTTSCRTLEAVASKYDGEIRADEDSTEIFIYPGYKFKCIDALITNFHLPESTLIMLVSAFLGYDKTMNAYNEAVKEEYRFFSFGDSMMIS